MRRKILLSACGALRQALTESGLAELYRAMRDERLTVGRGDRLLGAALRFAPLAAKFDAHTRAVMRILEFDFIEDSKWLTATVSGDEATAARNWADFAFAMSLIETYLPKFIGLVRADAAETFRASLHEPGAADFDTLQVIVIDDAQERTAVDRLVAVLQSVADLYSVACTVAGAEGPLTVLSLDSGGDKTIDFHGAAAGIAGVRDIMLSMWDKTVFYRSQPPERRNRLVAENLSVLWELQALQETGTLAEAEASRLRTRAIEAAVRFLASGAHIPDFENPAAFDPRTLMAPAAPAAAAKPPPASAPKDPDDSTLFDPPVRETAPVPAAATAERAELSQSDMRDLKRFLGRPIKFE